jgi:hypothetical protein
MKLTINIPDFLFDPVRREKFEAAVAQAGTEPGLYTLDTIHEEFCLERLGRGSCNCAVQFKASKYEP